MDQKQSETNIIDNFDSISGVGTIRDVHLEFPSVVSIGKLLFFWWFADFLLSKKIREISNCVFQWTI